MNLLGRKKAALLVAIDRDVYAAMQRLREKQGIPLDEQLLRGMRTYVNAQGIKVTKVER